jgi:hypothetical protein
MESKLEAKPAEKQEYDYILPSLPFHLLVWWIGWKMKQTTPAEKQE